ncbi:hypothetical protein PT974_01857 [Cladobotryum mycophilum]|uniref:Uncharacterized protein n=1 Tax=Cladobotryum mycophilum TaxID=491253 RepID=A0ABR0SWH9_9HYPO
MPKGLNFVLNGMGLAVVAYPFALELPAALYRGHQVDVVAREIAAFASVNNGGDGHEGDEE